MKKRFLAFLLTFAMIFSSMPLTAFAEEGTTPADDVAVVMDNIAAKYALSGVSTNAQAPWLTADMMAYIKTYPDTENKLSEIQKRDMADVAITKLASATSPSDAAKCILALVAMGFDPTQLTTADGTQLNAVEEKLIPLCFDEEGTITSGAANEYSLPYILIAYQQFGDTYAEEIGKLIESAIGSKDRWLSTKWGTDAVTPMILALAPYYTTNEDVKTAIDEGVQAIKAYQKADGSLCGDYGGGGASTGLAIAAFAALGIDPATVTHAETGKSLVDGLLAYADATKDGFDKNAFGQEQGFRGAIALANSKADEPYYLYDFSGQTLVPAKAYQQNEKAVKAIMDNIAAQYSASGVAAADHAPWLAADMMAYANTYPNTANKLTIVQKQDMADVAITKLASATYPSDAAKYVLALVAMGFDPTQLTTADGTQLNAVEEKLIPLCFDEEGTITSGAANEYSLPYILIAYQQFGDTYAEEIGKLVESAIGSKDRWLSTNWGTDAVTPMILALAPYYTTNEDVKTAVDAGVQAIKDYQKEDGSLNSGWGGGASTGLGIAAFAALGIDPATVTHAETGKSLVDGLLVYADESQDSFDGGSFGQEQGFRGAIALANSIAGEPYYLYDFSGQTLVPAKAYQPEVRFSVIPNDADVEVKDSQQNIVEPTYTYNYDLEAGTYTYTVSKDGYISKTGEFEVTDDDVAGNDAKIISISLVTKPSSSTKDISVHVKVLTHEADECNGEYTYKHNKSKYTVKLADVTVTIKSGQTAFDAFALAMEEAGLDYVEKSDSYIVKIGDLDEMDHGPNSGWLYMVNGKAPDVACRSYKLTSNCEMIWFYTDDFTNDYGSEDFMGSNSNNDQAVANKVIDLINAIGTVDKNSGEKITAARTAYDKLTDAQKKLVTNYSTLTKAEADFAALNGGNAGTFADVPADHWAADAIDFVVKNNLFQGTSDTTFEPETAMNRAMLVTVLWRLEGKPAPAADGKFSDVKAGSYYADAVAWANENGIVTGYENAQFGPEDKVTREQMAAVFARYAEYKGYDISQNADLSKYDDAGKISAYAKDSLEWANAVGLITGRTTDTLAPQGDSTRAEVATMFWRFVNNIIK